jgi:hypothetical protein
LQLHRGAPQIHFSWSACLVVGTLKAGAWQLQQWGANCWLGQPDTQGAKRDARLCNGLSRPRHTLEQHVEQNQDQFTLVKLTVQIEVNQAADYPVIHAKHMQSWS